MMPLLVVNGHTDSVYLINVSIYDVIAIFAMCVVIHAGFGIWLICSVEVLELLSTISLDLEPVELVVSDLAYVSWVAWRLWHRSFTVSGFIAVFKVFE